MSSGLAVLGPVLAAEGGVAVGADPHVHQHALAGAGGGDRRRQRGGQLRSGRGPGRQAWKPSERANAPRSGSGSVMAWPIQEFPVGRWRCLATRSWCTTSL